MTSDAPRQTTESLFPFQRAPWVPTWAKIFEIQTHCFQVGSWRALVYIENTKLARVMKIAGGAAADYHADNGEPVEYRSLLCALEQKCRELKADAFFVERLPVPRHKPPSSLLTLKNFLFWEASHQLTLNEKMDFESLYARKIPAKVRADSARQWRRISQKGPVTFRIASNEREAIEILEKTIEFKNKQYERLGTPSIFDVPEWRSFYFEMTRGHWMRPPDSTSPWVHASGLFVGEELVATHWGLVDKATLYYLLPTYETDSWGRFSPGRLHLLELLKWCGQNNIATFDFTVGDEPYKFLWCDTETPLYQVAHAVNLRGQLFVLKERLRNRLRASPRFARLILKLKRLAQRGFN